jgi:hypothetical protein
MRRLGGKREKKRKKKGKDIRRKRREEESCFPVPTRMALDNTPRRPPQTYCIELGGGNAKTTTTPTVGFMDGLSG